MFWHDSKKEKPTPSTAMEVHRVLVWYRRTKDDAGSWSTGYYLEEPLSEWRLDNSPSRFTDEDIPYWMEVPDLIIEPTTNVHIPGVGTRTVLLKEFNSVKYYLHQKPSTTFGVVAPKIRAIKAARNFWGLGLKEAKDFIESL